MCESLKFLRNIKDSYPIAEKNGSCTIHLLQQFREQTCNFQMYTNTNIKNARLLLYQEN